MKMYNKKFLIPKVIQVMLLLLVVSTVSEGYETRIGVITPFFRGVDSTLQGESVKLITRKLHELGGYDVFTEDRLRDAIDAYEEDYPQYCHEPRCAAVLGTILDLDKMLYGTVVENQNRIAVELTMVDVASHKIVNGASLEGDDGVSLEQVIIGVLNQIEEVEDTSVSVEMNRYYGEVIDRLKPMAIASGSWVAFGSLFSVIGNDRQDTYIEYQDTLSGIDPSMRATPKSARAKAMGNCYVAAAKDAYGAFYNPAGASWVDDMEASASYRNHFGMVNSMSASFVAKSTREIGWGHTFSYSGSPESYFQELDFGTLFSYKFNDLFGKLPPFSVGAALNIASTRTTGGSGSEYDQKGTEIGFGLDLGMLIELSRKIDLGLVFNNVPHVMFHNNKTEGTRSIENRPASFRLGATYEVGYATMLIAEGTLPLYQDQVFRFAGGVEQRLFSVLLFRLGAEKETLQSFDSPWHLTAGLGFDIPVKEQHVYIDGAYDFNTTKELRGVWDISIRWEL